MRGSYGTPMTVVRIPRQKPDPRRQGTCPKCFAMQGERCMAMRGERSFHGAPRGGVHRERLKANGIDPAMVFRKKNRSRRQRK